MSRCERCDACDSMWDSSNCKYCNYQGKDTRDEGKIKIDRQDYLERMSESGCNEEGFYDGQNVK